MSLGPNERADAIRREQSEGLLPPPNGAWRKHGFAPKCRAIPGLCTPREVLKKRSETPPLCHGRKRTRGGCSRLGTLQPQTQMGERLGSQRSSRRFVAGPAGSGVEELKAYLQTGRMSTPSLLPSSRASSRIGSSRGSRRTARPSTRQGLSQEVDFDALELEVQQAAKESQALAGELNGLISTLKSFHKRASRL